MAAAPLVSGYHPLVPVQQDGAWTTKFFDAEQAELVAAICERIIPTTDTPGARAALVHQYIDLILSEATTERRAAFQRGLVPFAGTDDARKDELLAEIADGAFFSDLKELTVAGYYGSGVGMKEELGFEGRTFVTRFDGCTHPEHLEWSPPADE